MRLTYEEYKNTHKKLTKVERADYKDYQEKMREEDLREEMRKIEETAKRILRDIRRENEIY
jgi:hypothetical protein